MALDPSVNCSCHHIQRAIPELVPLFSEFHLSGRANAGPSGSLVSEGSAPSFTLWICVPRQRPEVQLSFEESERRALLMKKWALYKQREHEMEREAIKSMLEAQKEALQELQLTSQELYAEAIKRDHSLFPFEREGPAYTPPISNYQPPEGRYHDITKVYTQVEPKR